MLLNLGHDSDVDDVGDDDHFRCRWVLDTQAFTGSAKSRKNEKVITRSDKKLISLNPRWLRGGAKTHISFSSTSHNFISR